MTLARVYSLVALVAGLSVAIMLVTGYGTHLGPAVVLLLSSTALFLSRKQGLKAFAFPIWVFASVAASLYYPWAFDSWFGYDLAILIVPLIQVIMFGMGTTLSVADFRRVVTEILLTDH